MIVLLLGAWSYFTMPRAQYPEVNLNWVAVATPLTLFVTPLMHGWLMRMRLQRGT